jgi:hypothetical protein
VAAWALGVIRARQRVAVHGWKNRLLAFGTRFAPRAVTVQAAKKTMEPWFRSRKAQ